MHPVSGGRLGITLLTGALAALGGCLLSPFGAQPPAAAGGEAVAVAAVGVLFVLSGSFVAHVRYGREGQEINARDAAIVVGLALLSPLTYAAVHVAGRARAPARASAGPAQAAVQRAGCSPPRPASGWRSTGGCRGASDPADARGLLAGLAAVALVTLLTSAAVHTAIALHSAGAADRPQLAVQTVGLLTSLACGTVGLLAVVLALRQASALPLLAVLLGVLLLAYRSQLRLTLGNQRLEVLYAFARASGQALGDDTVAHTVLVQSRELMSAETAELHLPAASTATGLRLTEDGTVTTVLAAAGRLVGPGPAGTPVHRRPQDPGPGPSDALAAPLYRDGEVMGALVVVDRMGDGERFHTSDAKVFGALAGTAGVSLHNAGLVARLRQEAAVREHSARHDALTGLPNRLGFREAVQRRLDPRPAVVLVVDIEGFQDVNDALGQTFGDELLVAVGRRLAHALGASVVARLSGDEFAVLVQGTDAAAAALQVELALLEPFGVGQVRLPVRVRAGSARLPRTAPTPTCCCAGPTSRCTGPSGSRAAPRLRAADEQASRERLPSWATCARRSPPGTCRSTTSRRWTCAAAGSSPWRRSCAGRTRPAARCARTSSSRSPRAPAWSTSSPTSWWAPPCATCAGGGRRACCRASRSTSPRAASRPGCRPCSRRPWTSRGCPPRHSPWSSPRPRC